RRTPDVRFFVTREHDSCATSCTIRNSNSTGTSSMAWTASPSGPSQRCSRATYAIRLCVAAYRWNFENPQHPETTMLPNGRTTRRCVGTAFILLAISLPIASRASGSGGGHEVFMSSAHVNGDNTVTLPLHHGRVGNRDVWFIILDTSSGELSRELGVNESQKLGNARGSRAVQKVRMDHDDVIFKASVNFCPTRVVVPGPHGFPPAQADPGAIAYDGYSPLIELPDGTIVNAPHIANWTGMADKVTHIDMAHRRVTYELTEGRQNNRIVHYVSTDASNPVAAALENVTFAPLLNEAPTVGGDGTDQARASLGAFVNGQTGACNPQRQGLNSALLDGLSPITLLPSN